MITALIDADSLYYILAWQFRERVQTGEVANAAFPSADDIAEMYGAVDQAVIGILQACGATHYLGAIGDKAPCFRYKLAKFKPYKSGRKDPEPWFKLWKPVIEARFREEWNFISIPGLEADDIIGYARDINPIWADNSFIICSPDKDLRQFPGRFFDYKKLDFADVSEEQAEYNFAFQMIAGDSSDGVVGIPGAGEKKAKEKLKEGKEAGLFPDQVVRSMYYKHFGNHYGDIIYRENSAVLAMLTHRHPFYGEFEQELDCMVLRNTPVGLTDQPTMDMLKSLGWG